MTSPIPPDVRTLVAAVLEELGRGPHTVGESIPSTCRIADVLRILNISAATFFAQRKRGTFPIPELEPPIDSSPRFDGRLVQAYLDGRLAAGSRRRAR